MATTATVVTLEMQARVDVSVLKMDEVWGGTFLYKTEERSLESPLNTAVTKAQTDNGTA